MPPPSQTQKLFNLLSDNQPHRTDEIVRVVYPSSNYCTHCGRGDMKSLARVGARVQDLKDGRWPGKTECIITGRRDSQKKGLYWYQMEFPMRKSAAPPSVIVCTEEMQTLF